MDTKTFKDWLKSDVNGELLLRHVNLLIQKTIAADDECPLTYTHGHGEVILKSFQSTK